MWIIWMLIVIIALFVGFFLGALTYGNITWVPGKSDKRRNNKWED